tara:strand:- start:364 stop:546 length:183 start_codon:yes stop_codon:yes gene_type:complete
VAYLSEKEIMDLLLQVEKEYDRTAKNTQNYHKKKYAMWGIMQTRNVRKKFKNFIEKKYSL